MLKSEDFFNNTGPLFKELFSGTEYVWNGIKNIAAYLNNHLAPNIQKVPLTGTMVSKTWTLPNGAVIHCGSYLIGKNIEIGPGSIIEPGAYVAGPVIIGTSSEIRHSAYIRGNVLIGDNCVIGHSTEIKNSVMLGKSKAGHFAYIGDSILGRCNLGAGTKLANLKITGTDIIIKVNGKNYSTGLRKFGSVIADGVETGCNSVTSPGTILSKNVILYPNTAARGYYPPDTIVKLRQNVELKVVSKGIRKTTEDTKGRG